MGIAQRTFYREKKYRCGEFLDVYIYPVFPVKNQDQTGRRIRKNPTREVQKKLNRRHAAEKLTRVLHKNFTEEDLAMTMTYRENPTDEKQVVKDVQSWLGKIRYRFKKQGKELKYVWQIEKSTKGRFHVHVVISNMDRDVAEKLWGKGYANAKRLQFGENGLTELANYMTKSHRKDDQERITYRSHNGSKNLIDPEPEISDSKIRSKKKAKELAEMDWNTWNEFYPDYQVTDLNSFHSDDFGGIYIFARLRETAGKNGGKDRGKIHGKRGGAKKNQRNREKIQEDAEKAGEAGEIR